MQPDSGTPQIIKAIRGAIEQTEHSSGVASDDPAIVELKHKVVMTVGELEVAKAKRQDIEAPSKVDARN